MAALARGSLVQSLNESRGEGRASAQKISRSGNVARFCAASMPREKSSKSKLIFGRKCRSGSKSSLDIARPTRRQRRANTLGSADLRRQGNVHGAAIRATITRKMESCFIIARFVAPRLRQNRRLICGGIARQKQNSPAGFLRRGIAH